MTNSAPQRLSPGQPVERQLEEGQIHPYLVHLMPGEYVRVAAEQRGVDLVLRLSSPAGERIATVDSPTGSMGAERVSEIAASAGDYLFEVVGGDGTVPGRYEIRIEEQGAATQSHRLRVEAERTFQEGEGKRRAKDFAAAFALYQQALSRSQEAGDPRGQGEARAAMGWMKENLEQWAEAADLCAQAAELFHQAGDLRSQARALNRRGRLLLRLGRYQEAQAPLEQAASMLNSTQDAESEATALTNLGNVYNLAGRFEPAVEAYDRALEIQRRRQSRGDEASALLSLGTLYLDHGKVSEARHQYESGLSLGAALADDDLSATALDGLAEIAFREGRLADARNQGEQALVLYRKLGDRRSEAIGLNLAGNVLLRSGDLPGAQSRFEEALRLFRGVGDAQGEAIGTAHLARVALARREDRAALQLGEEASARFEKLGYRYGRSLAHYVVAQAQLRLAEPDQARREIEASLELAEGQRTETESLDLRASYFATRQHYWELYIDVLLALDRLRPGQGFLALALEAEEGRRARSLLDALAEVRAEVRQTTSPALLREEEQVLGRLERTQESKMVEDLLGQLDRVRTKMREANPRLGHFESAKTLRVAEIQKGLLDTNTLLLVYSLGAERSVLWAVTRSALAVHFLPGRERIEGAARLARDLLSQRLRPGSDRGPRALQDLATLVLEPVAADLPKYKRLLIVADGALQLVPFAALPDPVAGTPAGSRPFLVESHSLISLPSASVGAALNRKRRTGLLHEPGPLIAVVADPVFTASDARVHPGSAPPPQGGASRGHLARSLEDLGLSELERLPFSRHEAEAILGLWRPGEVLPAFDFAASRELLEDDRWRKAPILHFATHSLLDDRQPELSGLVFSLVGPDGTPRPNGFLRLHEIYGLNLRADLVVLSACQTGVGKELRGEGLFSLTRGFLSIGVPQLVVSLWKVEDRATAELMSRFYKELFDGQRPPEALQRAQKSMLQDPQWSDPSLWAGFIFLGDYDRKPGGGIEATDTGGIDPLKRASTGGLPPPKVKPAKPKQKPRRLGPPAVNEQIEGLSTLWAGDEISRPKFACYSPSELGQGSWHTLLAYCSSGSVATEVERDSDRRLGLPSGPYSQTQVALPKPIASGSQVMIVPDLEGCQFNPPNASFFWLEDWHCAEFRFRTIPKRSQAEAKRGVSGSLAFYVSSILVASILFDVRVAAGSNETLESPGFRHAEAKPYQSVFVSYSRSDSKLVDVLEQAYSALGMSVLRDLRILRSGEEWQTRLFQKIDEADIFQLFWSSHAKKSKWVRAEWRHALGLKRPAFVRPVFWEEPMPRPPRELSGLMFHAMRLPLVH